MRIEVSAGVIVEGGKVLICRRQPTAGAEGLWEFPGGKREGDESAEQCLIRECMEELRVHLAVDRPIRLLDWSDKDRTLRFTFLMAHITSGTPECLEHQEIRWVEPSSLTAYAFCPPDAAVLSDIARALGHVSA